MGSNIAEPLRLRTPPSAPAPKTAELKEGGLANVGMQTRPFAPLPPSFLIPPAAPSHPARSSATAASLDLRKESVPASQGSGAEVSVPADVPPSGAGQLVGLSVLTSGLTAMHADEIFQLSHDIQTLRGKLAINFTKMSHTEANFRMGTQAASYEATVQERHASETWLHINTSLFRHAIDHQQFMVQLIERSQVDIQALHDRIWKVTSRIMGSAGRSATDGIGIALHLVGLLPTIPIQLAFNTITPELPGYTPRAMTWPSH